MCQKVASAMEKEQRRRQALCLGGLQFRSHVGIEGSIPGRRRYKSNDPEMAHGTWRMHGALKERSGGGCGQNRVIGRSGRRETRLGRASQATDSHLDPQDLTTHRMNE